MGNHATNVAGVLAGTGLGTSSINGDTSIGMSYAASVEAFNRTDEFVEIAALAIDDYAVSNHSYGLVAGWTVADIGASYLPVLWNDDLSISSSEASSFGRYTATSEDADDATRATPYTLPSWAAGNDTGESLSSLTTAGAVTFEVFKSGVTQGTGYYFAYVGATLVLHDGSQYWPTAGGTFNPSVPQFAVVSTARATALAGTPGADGGGSAQDSVPDGYGVSKNVLTVGAIDTFTSITGFSARGPVDDGRVKPDLVAPGDFPYMADAPTDSSYVHQPGTSFSAPAVAGSINLLAEIQKNAWGANEPFRSSTLKALTIHTAQNLGANGPDYTYGWGVPNFEAAAGLILSNDTDLERTYIKEIDIADGEEANFTIKTAGGAPVTVTAAWTDPAGTPVSNTLDPSTANLVNNLDLRVFRLDSSGNVTATYYPWSLNPANPTAVATRSGTNDRDNVEQVATAFAPSNQIWRVTVKQKSGTTIYADDGSTAGSQVASIALSGVVDRGIPFSVTSSSYSFSGGQVTATLTWGSSAGQFYVIESSTDLSTWVPSSGVFNAREDSTTGISDPFPTSPSRFFRVTTVAPGYVAP